MVRQQQDCWRADFIPVGQTQWQTASTPKQISPTTPVDNPYKAASKGENAPLCAPY